MNSRSTCFTLQSNDVETNAIHIAILAFEVVGLGVPMETLSTECEGCMFTALLHDVEAKAMSFKDVSSATVIAEA